MVRDHPSLSGMSPFDRAHTTSYSSSIETIRLSCTVYMRQRWIGPPSLYFGARLAFNASDLRKILHGSQRMAKVHIAKKYCRKLQPPE